MNAGKSGYGITNNYAITFTHDDSSIVATHRGSVSSVNIVIDGNRSSFTAYSSYGPSEVSITYIAVGR